MAGITDAWAHMRARLNLPSGSDVEVAAVAASARPWTERTQTLDVRQDVVMNADMTLREYYASTRTPWQEWPMCINPYSTGACAALANRTTGHANQARKRCLTCGGILVQDRCSLRSSLGWDTCPCHWLRVMRVRKHLLGVSAVV